jgi:hypothetical protein
MDGAGVGVEVEGATATVAAVDEGVSGVEGCTCAAAGVDAAAAEASAGAVEGGEGGGGGRVTE